MDRRRLFLVELTAAQPRTPVVLVAGDAAAPDGVADALTIRVAADRAIAGGTVEATELGSLWVDAGDWRVRLAPAGADAGPSIEDLGWARPRLRVVGADAIGHDLPATPAQRVVVGRGSAAGLRIDDPHLSREHFAIELGDDGYRAVDLGSTCGTRVDGAPLDGPRRLAHGTRIDAGRTTFEVVDPFGADAADGDGDLAADADGAEPATPPPPRTPVRRRAPAGRLLVGAAALLAAAALLGVTYFATLLLA